MNILKIVLILVILIYASVFCWDDHSLDSVLSALDKGVSYLSSKYTHLILDGVISLRIVSGQLKVLLGRIDSGELDVPDEYHDRILEIQRSASAISKAALSYTLDAKLDPVDPLMVKMASKNFWAIYHPTREPDVMQLHTNKTIAPWNGTMTDHCIVLLVHEQCTVTKECWDYVTEPGVMEYHLSHQAFYFLNGEGAGCWQGKVLKAVNHQTNRICTNLIYELLLETQMKLKIENRAVDLDLFMERLAFCGILGFSKIAQHDWLNRVLSWQIKPQGCWGDINTNNHNSFIRTGPTSGLSTGVKCYDHPTAVGNIAMTQFTRYIIEQYYNGIM